MPELDRRDFLKLVGAGAGAADTSACSDPVEKLVPYVIQPETITPGIPVFYASTCQECSAGCGIHVRTREGRPIKLEGNPSHPVNRGTLCARGQVGIGRAYHPDRYKGPLSRSSAGTLEPISWPDARAELVARLSAAAGQVWIMGGAVGPTLGGVVDGFAAAAGAAGRLVYEPFGYEALREATKAVFGISTLPIFDTGKADLIVDLGSDFLDTWTSPVENARQFAAARDIKVRADGGARLISVGPRMNVTTASSDRWIAARPGSEGLLALALARSVYEKRGVPAGGDTAAVESLLREADAATAASRAGIEPGVVEELAELLLSAKRPLVLPPGVALTSTAAVVTTAAVLVLDALLGAVGQSLQIPVGQTGPQAASMTEIQQLIAAMKSGQVKVLLLHDTNPVYSLPASSGFAEALSNVDYVVSTASLRDETSEAAHLVLPDHSAMESWGDSVPRPGVRSLIQPTLRPLHDTQALGDLLLDVGRALGGKMPAGSFRQLLESAWAGVDFRTALGDGGVFSDTPVQDVTLSPGLGELRFAEPILVGRGDHTLVAYPHSFLGDGSGAAQPWLQETPDPVTKLSWGSWLEMSFRSAENLGVTFGDVVRLRSDVGTIELSAFPRGGIRDDVVAIAIGQGHTVGHYASMAGDGEPGAARGASVISILPDARDENGGRVWLGTKVQLEKTGRFRRLALSQWTDNQRGRGLAQEVSLAALAGAGHDGGGEGGGEYSEHHEPPHSFEAAYDALPGQPYRWGMTVDTDRCTGCSACVTACAIENNIPVVGELQSIQHREMNWIRIERYIGDGDRRGGAERRPFPDREKLGELGVRHLPMPCQHCGAAPCEAVCPVIATYHTDEGINGMVYNRCVGTRYCGNNCVYKVRRFNYWDYGNDNFPGLLGLMLNPDVTVRQQGVMEKCSFCIQRIESARQLAKDEGRPIADGEVQSACQQTCPTQAIHFGNKRDEKSRVVAQAREPGRAYHVLQDLNTRSAITYLAQVKREDHEGSH